MIYASFYQLHEVDSYVVIEDLDYDNPEKHKIHQQFLSKRRKQII